MKTEIVQKREKTYLDFIKILAILLVIYNHTGESGFFRYRELEEGSLVFWLYLGMAVVCKIAVPLFFMVSGALLVKKEESVRTVLQKRVVRYGLVLFVCSFICYIYDMARNGNWLYFDILKFFRTIYSGPIISPYWFMYSYLMVLLVLPFLRPMILHMSKEAFQYLFVLQIIFKSIFPMLECILFKNEYHVYMNLLFTGDAVFYFVMGYYFECVREEKDTRNEKWLAIAALVMIVLSCVMVYYEAGRIGEYTEHFLTAFMAVPVVYTFCAVKRFCRTHLSGEKAVRGIAIIGSSVFVIYLTEYIYRDMLDGVYTTLQQHIPICLSTFLYVIMVAAAGFVTARILKRIPVIKRMI